MPRITIDLKFNKLRGTGHNCQVNCVAVYLQLHFDKCTHSNVISPIVVVHKIYKTEILQCKTNLNFRSLLKYSTNHTQIFTEI